MPAQKLEFLSCSYADLMSTKEISVKPYEQREKSNQRSVIISHYLRLQLMGKEAKKLETLMLINRKVELVSSRFL